MKESLVKQAARTHWSESTYKEDAKLAYDDCNCLSVIALAKSIALRAFEKGAEWQAKQSPWISIEERMPEDEQLVITLSSIYGVKLLVWNGHYNIWDDEDGDDVYCERDKIDVWMPIPE